MSDAHDPLPPDHPQSIHNVTSKAFRQFIRYKLQTYNLSQTDAGKATGISNGVISQWIRNVYQGDNRRIGEALKDYVQELDRLKAPGKFETDVEAFQSTLQLEDDVGSDDELDGMDVASSMPPRQVPRTPAAPQTEQEKSPPFSFATPFNTLPPTLIDDIAAYAQPPAVSTQQPHLIPLVIDLKIDTLHYKDYLLWNVNDVYLTVEAFVAELLSDLRLLPVKRWYQPLVNTIYTQIAAYQEQHGTEVIDLTQYYDSDEVLSIPIDVRHNGTQLRDQFLFAPLSSSSQPASTGGGIPNAVTEFSNSLCADLALPSEWKVVLTCVIQQQLLADLHQRKHGQPTTLKAIRKADVPSLYRTKQEARQYSPMLFVDSEPQHEPLNESLFVSKAKQLMA